MCIRNPRILCTRATIEEECIPPHFKNCINGCVAQFGGALLSAYIIAPPRNFTYVFSTLGTNLGILIELF